MKIVDNIHGANHRGMCTSHIENFQAGIPLDHAVQDSVFVRLRLATAVTTADGQSRSNGTRLAAQNSRSMQSAINQRLRLIGVRNTFMMVANGTPSTIRIPALASDHRSSSKGSHAPLNPKRQESPEA